MSTEEDICAANDEFCYSTAYSPKDTQKTPPISWLDYGYDLVNSKEVKAVVGVAVTAVGMIYGPNFFGDAAAANHHHNNANYNYLESTYAQPCMGGVCCGGTCGVHH